MSPPKLTAEQKKASIERRKEYIKEYQRKIPIELKRIYKKTVTAEKQHEYRKRRKEKNKEKQVLKNLEKSL